MATLFRVFVLKELHRWQHETSPVEYLNSHPELCERLELESVPDQSTLRRMNKRFARDLRETNTNKNSRSESALIRFHSSIWSKPRITAPLNPL